MGPKAEADVLQMLDELQEKHPIRYIIVCGGSMGGSSALTLAALHPERIDGVVSLNGLANHVEYQQFQDAIAQSFGGTKAEAPEEYRRRIRRTHCRAADHADGGRCGRWRPFGSSR